MRIKELHLRNIASIERADIDFENGLREGADGGPAGIFLISGDTGAGKSAILDGISMALYRKTPRIAGVANIRNNEYTDSDGKSVSINSIEQYTRIGIGVNDECYSEVVFDSNDGTEYRARLRLGIMRGNRDKTTGERPVRYRSPQWQVKAGAGDWQNVESRSGQPIRDAVGLGFEQFNRMAMLAQGQFAAFLTGDKKERESILEQLTNTSHFSTYGAAIKNLTDKAKEAYSRLKTEYDTESRHILSAEEAEALDAKRRSCMAEKERLAAGLADTERRLRALEEIEKATEGIREARIRLDALAARREELRADLGYRKALAASYADEIRTLAQWFDERKACHTLYDRAGEADIQIGRIIELTDARGKAETEVRSMTEAMPALVRAVEDSKRVVAKATQAVGDRQAEIDRVTAERTALRPAEVNASIHSVMERRNRMAALSERLYGMLEMERALMAEAEAIEKLSRRRAEAEKRHEEARAVADKASRRLALMQTSVERTLKTLRHSIYEQRAEICPLCGQHIGELHLDSEFDSMLSPIRTERDEAQRILAEAERAHIAAEKEYSEARGRTDTIRGRLTAEQRAAAAEWATLEERPLPAVNSAAISELGAMAAAETERLESLRGIQARAETLQQRITGLYDAMKPMERTRSDAEQARADAAQALERTMEEIKRRTVSIEAAETDIGRLYVYLHPLLDMQYPRWELNPSAMRERLRAEAKTYAGKKRMMEEQSKAAEELNTVIEIIEKTDRSIPGESREDDGRKEPREYAAKDILSEWTMLYGAFRSATEAIRNNSEAIERLRASAGENADKAALEAGCRELRLAIDNLNGEAGAVEARLKSNSENRAGLEETGRRLEEARATYARWETINGYFGGTRFRTLVQTHILRPLLNNANIYLQEITDRYRLTCSESNEQLAILVEDRYNRNSIRSATVLSGGERFMISLALSLALSSLNRPDMNINILFIDEGFGTLDEKNLDSVMKTLERLRHIAGQSDRRVGIISHREELRERIPVQILVEQRGEGRSSVTVKNS